MSNRRQKALKASVVSGKLPDLAKLKADYKRLTAEKDTLYTEYGKLKRQLRKYDAVKQNIDSILHPVRGREQEKALWLHRQSHIIYCGLPEKLTL